MEKSDQKKNVPPMVQGTEGAKLPDPSKAGQGETEDRIKDAFQGRPLTIPDTAGDLADRAYPDQEAELDEKIARIRSKVRKP